MGRWIKINFHVFLPHLKFLEIRSGLGLHMWSKTKNSPLEQAAISGAVGTIIPLANYLPKPRRSGHTRTGMHGDGRHICL